MGLDYTDGCVNFRDVGGYLNLLTGERRFQEGKLFRGGSIDYIKEHNEIQNAQTIINLRKGPDDNLFDMNCVHFPMSNKIEKYHTAQKEVRVWLNQILQIFEKDVHYPVLVHCLSGKDRTGIVIAAILSILGIEKELIVEEYMLSMGEVKREWILLALEGIKETESYFSRIELTLIRKNLERELFIS
jgi:protein-tyrosine phosphatase